MSVPIHHLDCRIGCQGDRLKFLFEQYALDMDEVLNNLQTDHIELCNLVEAAIIPYLEFHASRGDEEATDLIIELAHII